MSEPFTDTIVINNPYVTCYMCDGRGYVRGAESFDDCYSCGGNGVIRDRDKKGRFITHPYTMYHIGDGIYDHKPPTNSPQGQGPSPEGE